MNNLISGNSPSPSLTPTPSGTDFNSTAPIGAYQTQRRLPLRQRLCVVLPTLLRARIAELSVKTGKPSKSIFLDLVSAAADVPVSLIVVEPKQGAAAGAELASVEKALELTFCALQNAKGHIASHGLEVQRLEIRALVLRCIELWTRCHCLAKETFYGRESLERGRKAYRIVSDWLEDSRDEEAVVTADPEKIASCKDRIVAFEVVLSVLSRLGFGPGATSREK